MSFYYKKVNHDFINAMFEGFNQSFKKLDGI